MLFISFLMFLIVVNMWIAYRQNQSTKSGEKAVGNMLSAVILFILCFLIIYFIVVQRFIERDIRGRQYNENVKSITNIIEN